MLKWKQEFIFQIQKRLSYAAFSPIRQMTKRSRLLSCFMDSPQIKILESFLFSRKYLGSPVCSANFQQTNFFIVQKVEYYFMPLLYEFNNCRSCRISCI